MAFWDIIPEPGQPFDITQYIKIPVLQTEITVSKKLIAVLGVMLTVIAFLVLRPFKKRSK